MAIIPHLLRALGPSAWGQYVICQAVVNQLLWLCNWSFYEVSVSKIARHRDDHNIIRLLYAQTYSAQIIITLLAAGLFSVLHNFSHVINVNRSTLTFGWLLLLGNLMSPLWLLNGLDNIKLLSLFKLLPILISTPFLYFSVSNPSDVNQIFLIQGLSSVFVGIIIQIYISRVYSSCRVEFSFYHGLKQLVHGFKYYISSFWSSSASTLFSFVYSYILGDTALGLLNVCLRVKNIGIQASQPIIMAVFPRLSHHVSSKSSVAIALFFKTSLLVLLTSSAISLFVYIFSPQVILFIGGNSFQDAVVIMRPLALGIIAISLSECLIYNLMTPYQMYNNIHNSKLLVFLLVIAVQVPFITILGSSVIGQIITFCDLIYFLSLLVPSFNHIKLTSKQ